MTRRSSVCYCGICGVSSLTKPVMFSTKYNMLLCGKHKWELDKYGEIKNPTQYNRFDRNRYRVQDGVVYMDICDAFQNKVAEALFDEEYLDAVTPRKWRLTYKGHGIHPYVSTKALPEEKVAHVPLHRFIAKLSGMDIDGLEIDHINGDPLDNRKCNLRCATRHEQVSNIAPRYNNKFGIRGVSFDKKNQKYTIDFQIDGFRLYFKPVKTLPEAVYIRHLAEQHFFDDVAIARHLPDMQPYIDQLSDAQKRDLEAYVDEIIQKKERDAS